MHRIIKIRLNDDAALDEFRQPPLVEGNRNGISTEVTIPMSFLYDPVFCLDGIDLANQVNIGAVIKTYEGKEIGELLNRLPR